MAKEDDSASFAVDAAPLSSGVGRLQAKKKKKFKDCPVGLFQVDIAEASTGEGRLYPFVAIVDRTCKFLHAEVHGKKSTAVAAAFVRDLIAVVPYPIHAILTDNGVRFTNGRRDRRNAAAYVFDKICWENKIEHRLAKVYRP